jgi:uncharacterized protein YgiM (DUF1202 family)
MSRYSILLLSLVACTPKQVVLAPPVDTTPPRIERVAPETVTVTVRDPELERRLARLELQLWERDAQADETQQRLEEAQQEVVRAMSKIQSLATRAEAGSGMAEADVALQQLGATGQQLPELRKATQLMAQSQEEFNKGNYGGAVYLANLSKASVAAGRRRLGDIQGGALRPGEVLFAVPIALKASSRANVRDGPGTASAIVFTAESGASLTGVSYQGDWVRVSDDGGRQGWVNRSLLALR